MDQITLEEFLPFAKKFHPCRVHIIAPGATKFKNVLHQALSVLIGRNNFR